MAKKLKKTRQPADDPLVHRAFPELGRALQAQVPQIIEDWITLVRRALPLAAQLSAVEIEDHLPDILSRMFDALASDSTKVDQLKEESPAQGAIRFQQKYAVRDLMTEDRLLRRVIIVRAEAALRRRMTQDEQIGLDTAIDLMLQEAIAAFIEHQNAHLRTAAEAELKYLSFLSHDLNNNLGTVTLWLQVLKSQLASSDGFREAVETLDTAQQAILDTIGGMGRLLQAERLRRAGVKPTAAPVHLHSLVMKIVDPVSAQPDRKGVRIEVDVDPSVTVVSDGELILLVLQNLIGNAIKYSTNGTVRIECCDEEDGRLVVSVSDEGPGIAPEHLERIFTAFSRGQTYGQLGVGLGLTIASQAARLLGGELKVESRVGQGSKFSLVLPATGTARVREI